MRTALTLLLVVIPPAIAGAAETAALERFVAPDAVLYSGDSKVVQKIGDEVAFEVDLDRQGRIVVPQEMRTAVGLDSRVAIVGCGDYVELWDPQRWTAELDAADSEAEEDEA